MTTAASNKMTPQTTSTEEAEVQATYCALDVLPELSRYPFNPETYPLVDRQLLFWHWVAESYVKDGSTSRSTELRCPLLWCRKPFGKANDLLQHVIVCTKLKDGEYWCPKHQAPERFSWPNSEEAPSNTKPFSGIHKAFKLLCELRMVSLITPLLPVLISRRRQHSLRRRSSAYNLDQPQSSPATASNYLVSPSSISVPALSDSQISDFTNTATTSPLTLATRSLDPRTQWVQQSPSHDQDDYSKAHVQGHFNTIDNELGLSQANMGGGSSLQQRSTLGTLHDQGMSNRLYSAHDINYDATYGMGYGINDMNNMNTLPLNTTEMLLGHMSAGEDPGQYHLATDPGKLGQLAYPEYPNTNTVFSQIEDSLAQRSSFESNLRGIRVGNHFLPLQSPGNWNTLGSIEQPSTPLNDANQLNQSMLAQSVCDVSLIIFKRFENQNPRQEMSENIKAWVDGTHGFIPRPETLLQHGLASLQGVLRGHLPTTAVDVNPVVYLAFVAALVLDEAGTDELAKDMAEGTQQWGALITNKEERDQFLEIQSQGALSMRSEMSQQEETDPPTEKGKKRSRASEDPGASKFKRTGTKLVPHPRFPSLQETPDADKLLAGRVAQICLLLLDVVEYSNRLAHAGDHVDTHQAMNWPPEPLLSQPILLSVTTKLDEMQGIEGFKPVISSVSSYIRSATSGLPLREVELKLIFDGWHASQDRVAYRHFVSTVRHICKEIGENPMLHPMPRDVHYTRAIDVLSRLIAVQSRSGPVTIESAQPSQNLGTRSDFPKQITPRHESLSSIPSPGSTNLTGSEPPPNSTSEPSTRRASSASHARPANQGQAQSPPVKKEHSKSREQPSSSTSSQANPTVVDSGSLVCGICDQKFTGQKKNLKSNLKRHMKTIHPTEEDTVLCPICRTRFNNRTDNLLAHQRNVHGIFN